MKLELVKHTRSWSWSDEEKNGVNQLLLAHVETGDSEQDVHVISGCIKSSELFDHGLLSYIV